MRLLAVASSLFVLSGCVSNPAVPDGQKKCKCFPGDACWPSKQEWDEFNTTVGGRLIKTVPLGSPCHDPHYDAALCETLRSQWTLSPVQLVSRNAP